MNDLMQELDAMVAAEQATKSKKPKARGGAEKGADKASPANGGSELSTPSIQPYAPVPHHATRRIFLVRTQQCNVCGRKHPVIAGEFIEFAWSGGLATHRAIPAPTTDHTFDWLPREVEWLGEEEVTCPDCLIADILTDELRDAPCCEQLHLFPWSDHAPS